MLRELSIYDKANIVYPLILRARSSMDSNLLLETEVSSLSSVVSYVPMCIGEPPVTITQLISKFL